jgi:hypothetical protein
MALCTKCGTLLHEDDVEAHVCAEEDLPQKGTPKKFQPKTS